MLSVALKDNEFLERSLISSSVRLSGVYSWEANNQYHALFPQNKYFSETYEFTGEEDSLLKKDAFQVVKDFDGVKKWYNGYQILSNDEATIYNGWSFIQYLSNDSQEAIGKLIDGESISIVVAELTVGNILELKRKISYPKKKLNESQVNFFLQLLWDDGLLNALEKYGNTVELKILNLEIRTEIEQRYIQALNQLLLTTTSSNEQESDEEESKIEESEEGTTKKCEEAMCNLVNAVSLLFSDDAAIPVNESELHHILFYLAYNNRLFVTQFHRAVVKVAEELRDSAKLKKVPRRKAKGSYQSKRNEKRGRKNECGMCVILGTVAVLFEFKFLKDEEAENSKTALQQII
ncbi:hypothetical protein BDFB_013926 [Asbolus verrucosus]|uniref:Uncharacterized protein n=1 Tax=Asbolus verrucosus TaxID=1661398 RepID=A0A482VYC4_ASBVE|nr:hypothetical protein BDFB_013926 [Asbolus verrucosus]